MPRDEAVHFRADRKLISSNQSALQVMLHFLVKCNINRVHKVLRPGLSDRSRVANKQPRELQFP